MGVREVVLGEDKRSTQRRKKDLRVSEKNSPYRHGDKVEGGVNALSGKSEERNHCKDWLKKGDTRRCLTINRQSAVQY